MSPKPPPHHDAAYEDAFKAICFGMYDFLLAACERRTPADGPLSKWEKLAVWLYATTTGPWFKELNGPLREKREPRPPVRIVIECLEDAIGKLPPYKGLAWRGIRVDDLKLFLDDYTISDLGEGAEVVWHAFSSASLDPVQAVTGNVLFIVQSEDGRLLGAYADIREEQEVLFAPGSRFRVQGLERTSTKTTINLRQVAPFVSSRQEGGHI